MYDRDRRPMSRRAATITGAVLGGAAGAGIGYGVSRDGRGSLIGAGIGAGVGALIGLATHRGNDNKDVIVTAPPSQQTPPQQRQVYWSHGAPVAVGYRPNVASGGYQPVSSPTVQQGGDWRIRNHSGFKVELWDGERFVILLQPGQTMVLFNPDGIRGVMLIPSSSGKIDQRETTIKASRDFDGWDLLAPSVP